MSAKVSYGRRTTCKVYARSAVLQKVLEFIQASTVLASAQLESRFGQTTTLSLSLSLSPGTECALHHIFDISRFVVSLKFFLNLQTSRVWLQFPAACARRASRCCRGSWRCPSSRHSEGSSQHCQPPLGCAGRSQHQLPPQVRASCQRCGCCEPHNAAMPRAHKGVFEAFHRACPGTQEDTQPSAEPGRCTV